MGRGGFAANILWRAVVCWGQYSAKGVDYMSNKITRCIGILNRFRQFITRDSLLLLYHTLIEPHYRYWSILWGQCGLTLKGKLQTLQNNAARTIAKPRYDEDNHDELLTEFGWFHVRKLINLDTAISCLQGDKQLAS